MILRAMLAVAYATGRASHARQIKGDDPDTKGYPGPPGWGFGMGLTTPPLEQSNTILNRLTQICGYADDVLVIAKSFPDLEALC